MQFSVFLSYGLYYLPEIDKRAECSPARLSLHHVARGHTRRPGTSPLSEPPGLPLCFCPDVLHARRVVLVYG